MVRGTVDTERAPMSDQNTNHDKESGVSASRRFYEAGEWATDGRPEDDWLLSRLRPLVRERRDLVLLDLGCGDGAMARRLLGQVPDIRAVGIDVSYRALARSTGAGLHVVQAQLDGQALPIASGMIDVVVLTQVIEHMVD